MSDISKAIKVLEELAEIYRMEQSTDSYYATRYGIEALKEKEARDNPKPLTLEELKEQTGKWVWVLLLNKSVGALCCTKVWQIGDEFCYFCDNGHHRDFCLDDYGKTWLAYPYEPKEAR
jgi:hypothetical protein